MSERNWRTLDELLRDPNVEGKRFVEADRAEAAERSLFECAKEAGADTSDGIPTWPPLAEWAVKAVKELRADCDSDDNYEAWQKAEATLAAVREALEAEIEHCRRNNLVQTSIRLQRILAILDREGKKCPTCGGTDRTGGTVATSGPDEFGNYDTDDCPDDFHR